MTMITPSYLGETIEYSSLHACRSTLEDPTDDPPLVIQDMDLLSSLTLELSHTENPTPNGLEVSCQMTLAR